MPSVYNGLGIVGDGVHPRIPWSITMALTEVTTGPFLIDKIEFVPPLYELTIAQARTFLRMSERHLNDLLDVGEIKFRLVGNERMILRESLLAFELERERLRIALDAIVQDSQEMGLYDD